MQPALEREAHTEKAIEDLKTTLERSPPRSSVDAINQEILLRRRYLLGEDPGVYKRDWDAVLGIFSTT